MTAYTDSQQAFRLLIFFGVLALLITLAFPRLSYALSDAEYKEFMASSPAFAKAEAKLNAAWKAAKNTLPKKQFEILRGNQKRWVAEGYDRDYAAKQLVEKQGKSLPEAYADVTWKRAELIEWYARPENRRPQSKTGTFSFTMVNMEVSLLLSTDENPSQPISLSEETENLDALLKTCENGDMCTVTGILDIDGQYFISITNAALVKKGDL